MQEARDFGSEARQQLSNQPREVAFWVLCQAHKLTESTPDFGSTQDIIVSIERWAIRNPTKIDELRETCTNEWGQVGKILKGLCNSSSMEGCNGV